MPSLASARPMQLICLSPSRSGTHALYEALGLLGYQPYHFIETLKQGISHQKLARELLDAWQSGTVKPYSRGDFDKWFGNYDALTEVPAYAVPQMVAAYPEAKFLLLERSPKSWAKSFQEAVIPEARRAGQFPANFLKLMDTGFREFNDMFYIIGHEVSGGVFDGPGGFENCIRWYEEQFAIEPNPQLTSKGPITNPRDKWCPKNLRPRPDFIEQQRIVFGTLYDTFPTKRRVFENRNFLAGLGNRISQRPIADEKTLEYFLHNSVEDPVRAILQQLKRVEEVSSAYLIGEGIIFENHPHAISDVAEEVVARETPASPPRTPNHRRDLHQLRPDQICVYRDDSSMSALRTMVYICEYKPPHKLTVAHLRVGLRAMDIYKEVVNRKLIPTSADPDARFQYHAEKLVASAITQTYHYIVESGLEYGLLTTGEVIVFLKVDWDEPQTLHYHLAEPGPEVLAHPNSANICSALGQYLAFTLMALGAPYQAVLNSRRHRPVWLQRGTSPLTRPCTYARPSQSAGMD